MSFKSIGVFKCDGCKVIESDGIEVPTDIMQAMVPAGWLRIEMNKTVPPHFEGGEALRMVGIKHFCPGCTVLIESYLEGRDESKPLEDEETH